MGSCKSIKNNPKFTLISCFGSYISQAIIINFLPLLFLTFNRQYGISIEKITLLVTVNFTVQLITDILSSKIVKITGLRGGIVAAHILCTAGLWCLALLPGIMKPYTGIFISVVIYSVGGGLLEVIASPIVESTPVKNKSGLMSLMHSFYCWGVVLTVLVSTLFFVIFSTDNWKYMSIIWSIIPGINAILFTQVPIYNIPGENKDTKSNFVELFSQGIFWILLVCLICGGAAEQAIAQWASTFAEAGLHVSKTTGDLVAVCGFSVSMGLSRLCYSFLSEKFSLKKAIFFGSVFCIGGYALVSFSSSAVLGMAGCIISGFAVGVFWPGTLSLAAKYMKHQSTLMYSILALGGDIGCVAGPAVVGLISDNSDGGFRAGLIAALIFPLGVLISIILISSRTKSN